jgi:hypothetical protein
MKNKIKFIIPSIFCAAMMFSFNSCKKDDTPTPEASGTLYMHIHTNVDTTEADSGLVCTDATGRHYQLNLAQFYMSNIVLHKADGTTYTVPNTYELKTIDVEEYLVAGVPAGNYSYVSFDVGIDAATNAMDPSMMGGGLGPQTPSMWFGSTTQGYMFMNVQGIADTTAAQTGPVNCAFSYQLGTSSMLRNVTLPAQAFSVVSGQAQIVHIIADYGHLLQGINFKTQGNATPFVNAAVATQIANNIPNMFRYEY